MSTLRDAELVGILNIAKPAGWTSHDVVARVRRVAGQKRVGHAGTLDPMATGVLPVLLGRATRLADLLHTDSKSYRAVVHLGASTTTDDVEGEVTATSVVPPLDLACVASAVQRFVGEIEQVPPRYSAVKVAGQRAYALARRGTDVQIAPRRVTIHAARVLAIDDASLELDITCSSGTYVRALARDLASALGTLGHLAQLVRTRVGPFELADAVSLETLSERGPAAFLRSPACALPHAHRIDLTPESAARLRHGQALPWDAEQAEHVWVYDADALACLGRLDGQFLRSRILL